MAVDGALIGAEPHHQFEDQAEGVLPGALPLSGIGSHPDSSEDRLHRVGSAQVSPVLLGEVIEGDEVRPIPLQAVSRIAVTGGSELGAVPSPPAVAFGQDGAW